MIQIYIYNYIFIMIYIHVLYELIYKKIEIFNIMTIHYLLKYNE